MAVERAFGKLKSRWRILKNVMEITDMETIVDVIDVCCILHNLCIDCDDIWDTDEYDQERIGDGSGEVVDVNEDIKSQSLRNATHKRNNLVSLLYSN